MKYFFLFNVFFSAGFFIYILYRNLKFSKMTSSAVLLSFAGYHFALLIVQNDLNWQLNVSYMRITWHFYPAVIYIFLTSFTKSDSDSLFMKEAPKL